MSDPLRLAVIVGSTREGRAGDVVARWFAGLADQRPDLSVGLVDLAEYDFPARYPQRPTGTIAAFTGAVAAAEAYAVVTPEYNRSFPASLKQAIDYGYDEWHAKPVGFVSYGSHSDGWYAVEHLRTVFTELHVVTMRTRVGVDLLTGVRDEGGATALLDQLTWWGLSLREARARRPYAA